MNHPIQYITQPLRVETTFVKVQPKLVPYSRDWKAAALLTKTLEVS